MLKVKKGKGKGKIFKSGKKIFSKIKRRSEKKKTFKK